VSDWPKDIDRHWFAIARSDAVSSTPACITLFGRRWAVARERDGAVMAVEDRCPHRQAPLSAGSMTQEGLRCPYHGWTFSRSGSCVRIPGWPPDQSTPEVRIPTLLVVEHDGLVWAAAQPGKMAAPPPAIVSLDPKSRRFLWQTRWSAPILEALENFLDALHTHLVHPGLVRRDSRRVAATATLTKSDEGFTVDYRGGPKQSGMLYWLFESPRAAECARFYGPGVAQIEYRYENGSTVLITLCFTPESADATHVFTILHVTGRWAPAWAVRLFVWPFLRQVARQDQRILELQTETTRAFPARRPMVTKLDLTRPYLEAWWGKAESGELPRTHSIEFML
jgi:phenylpropionate dioxygenase-like ring-hydroxylating dioxygenase large terminal subunit